MKNAYEVLQVFPSASAQEIKDAFRFLLFRFHPDHNKGREEWAVQRTMELVEAYHILSDAGRRAHHDVVRSVKPREERAKKGFSLFGGNKEKEKLADEEFLRGVEACKAEEYENALKRFGRTLELSPDNPNTKFNLALAFLAIERLSEAQEWLQELLSKNKDDAEAKTLFGKIAALTQKMYRPQKA